jgi:isoaspartyl peptidase/L-asparaginase-like protein (Ntn-hydrolase superfamily)
MFAGRHGAVAATGTGERIIEESVGRSVHSFLQRGEAPAAAAKRAVERIRGKGSIGIIVIGRSAMGAVADRPMAWAAREAGNHDWLGPAP